MTLTKRERANQRRAERRERGLCLDCGSRNDRYPKWFCTKCLEKHNQRTLKWAREAKAKGICTCCGLKRDRKGWVCSSCLRKELKRKEEKRRERKSIKR